MKTGKWYSGQIVGSTKQVIGLCDWAEADQARLSSYMVNADTATLVRFSVPRKVRRASMLDFCDVPALINRVSGTYS